ncbi:MAG TPA: site-specific DNA-methyltransferase [Longimicrobiaceae bacterium]|nr:site-specific DNA-methyltransferase [Longimicrobiaceae bacterium]
MSSAFAANQVFLGDNLEVLSCLPSAIANLIYIDPPFNTGMVRRLNGLRVVADEDGSRVGFGGRRYRAHPVSAMEYADHHDDYLAFLRPRLEEAYRLLAPDGSLYFHIDYREVHYCKILLDEIFGRESFLNEIIWAYDYGGRPRRRWAPKHDNILLYVKDLDHYTFDLDAVERIPYMAPGLVTPEKAARGKWPTDTWWHTIVPTNGKERTGYPTQKPLGVLRRIVAASSRPGDTVLDFFAGSGTTGAACLELERRFILVDDNPEAVRVMRERFAAALDIEWFTWPAALPSMTGRAAPRSPGAP